QTRRGVNATAVDFGNRVSVLAGDYLFAWIFKNVTANYPSPVPHILSATLADICDGEVLQLRALGDLDLTLDAYVEVAGKKTASLFAASAECGAIMGGGTHEDVAAARDFGRAYGIAFQMVDDVLDLTADERSIGKPVGNDLAERKMTVPLVLALENGNGAFRTRIERFFEDGDDAEIPAIAREIDANGGLAATRLQIDRYAARARAALQPLRPGAAKEQLAALADGLLAG
ncbi:MAG: polyprenyl synthetase family protein, partial [Vulcanimicrobiaceae bacterium]